jgi:hypothetical protein
MLLMGTVAVVVWLLALGLYTGFLSHAYRHFCGGDGSGGRQDIAGQGAMARPSMADMPRVRAVAIGTVGNL